MEPSDIAPTMHDPAESEDYQRAVRLVEAGYRAIQHAFDDARQRGAISRGKLLSEVVTSTSWSPPPLLNGQKLGEFCTLTGQYLPTEVLSTLYYILEHTCNERRLLPALRIQRGTYDTVVTLVL